MSSRRAVIDTLSVEEYLANDAYYDNNQIAKNYAPRTRGGFRQVERKWNTLVYAQPQVHAS